MALALAAGGRRPGVLAVAPTGRPELLVQLLMVRVLALAAAVGGGLPLIARRRCLGPEVGLLRHAVKALVAGGEPAVAPWYEALLAGQRLALVGQALRVAWRHGDLARLAGAALKAHLLHAAGLAGERLLLLP